MAINNYTRNGKCPEGCSKCCTNILPLSQKEIDTIKKYINDNGIKVINHNTILSGYVDICPFVNEMGKCNIYSVRPEVCDYFFCDPELKVKEFNHKDKHIVNLLTTFNPSAFCPEGPDVNKLEKIYQLKKKDIF